VQTKHEKGPQRPAVIFRADAGTDIGIGHVMRCIALAQALKNKGCPVSFVSRCRHPQIKQRIAAAGFELFDLDRFPNPRQDRDRFRKYLKHYQPEATWLVIDGIGFDEGEHKVAHEAGCRLLLIDDDAKLDRYRAELLLNQNIGAARRYFGDKLDGQTQTLCGTRYVLLRKEFLNHPEAFRAAAAPQPVAHLLVTLGGADPDNATGKVLAALHKIAFDGLEVRVVVGAANPNVPDLEAASARSRSRVTLVLDPQDMPAQMAWADAAVTAGGTTCWELAYMGVPFLVGILAENQEDNATGLAEKGAAINCGWFHRLAAGELTEYLGRLLSDGAARARRIEAGRRLVDGGGCRRVVAKMFAYDRAPATG
jgi:UDP-2,4-diacetamido-2,4,6-trideoxy-beta-L-altropyranose hydrolase